MNNLRKSAVVLAAAALTAFGGVNAFAAETVVEVNSCLLYTSFQSSLETTSLLKELGAKFVVSRAARDVHAKFLLRNGADDVVYPERQLAKCTSIRYSSDLIFVLSLIHI